MGGDRITSASTPEYDSSLEDENPHPLSGMNPTFLRDNLKMEIESGAAPVHKENGLFSGDFNEAVNQFSPAFLDFEVNQRRQQNVYKEILDSYEQLLIRSENLREAKNKILSYTPGAWIERAGAMELSDYDVPKMTTLILIGPKGSGKSSLVNRISKVFEDDKFAPERAQVSYNSAVGEGTYFLQEYTIPRGSTSFCLYDTRSFCDDSYDNTKMIKNWMTNGVRHGKLIIRKSDAAGLRHRMTCKARKNRYWTSEIRKVNFVIFVVDGRAVLKSIDSDADAESQYIQTVAQTYNCPFLSFRDDKPVVVVTHGDLLSLANRARVRIHLGELLGVPPATQIFDIPESFDPVTELTIVDMLRYSLEHADRNLPHKDWAAVLKEKVSKISLPSCLYLSIILGIAILSAYLQHACFIHAHKSKPDIPHIPQIDWARIRHLWLDLD